MKNRNVEIFAIVAIIMVCLFVCSCNEGTSIYKGNMASKSYWIDAIAYNDGKRTDQTIIEAVRDIGSAEATLLLSPGKWKISSSFTIPSNICVQFSHGAVLDIDNSKKVDIDGPIEAAISQIFSGKGVVRFGSGYVLETYPQWYGAKADGVSDCTQAIQAAFDSGVKKIVFPYGEYKTDSVSVMSDLAILGNQSTIIPYAENNPNGPCEVFLIDATKSQRGKENGGESSGTEHRNRITIDGFTFNGNADYLINCVGGGIRFCTFQNLAIAGGKGKSILRFYNNSKDLAPSRTKIYNIDARVEGWDYVVHISRNDEARAAYDNTGVAFDNFNISRINAWPKKDVVYASAPTCNFKITEVYGGLFKNKGQSVINLDSDRGDWNKNILVSSVHMESWKANCVAVRLNTIQYSNIRDICAIRVNTTKNGNRALKLTNVANCEFSNFILYDTGQLNKPEGYYPRIEIDPNSTHNRIHINNVSKYANWVQDHGSKNNVFVGRK